jgi:hypothetical protein
LFKESATVGGFDKLSLSNTTAVSPVPASVEASDPLSDCLFELHAAIVNDTAMAQNKVLKMFFIIISIDFNSCVKQSFIALF